ncbi:MAG: L,D-transpeptidase family protein [Colwellia sp.]|nr:L,D-transpeptidase family protein [Colwellia sp.]
MEKIKAIVLFFSVFTALLAKPLLATVYDMGGIPKRLIGESKVHKVVKGDYFQQLAEQYDVGFLALLAANPKQHPFLLQIGEQVVIPNEMLLPYISREGIVVNLPELRLYYFLPDDNKVYVFPVGIGKQGLSTPLTNTYIGDKRKDPVWRPTQETQERYFAEHGKYLAKEVPAGPNNPFGKYALRLGTSEYLIHGSNKRFGIGMCASSGCIRMYDDDIKWLFDNVALNTKVRIINQPVKMSYESGNKQLIEIHEPLSDMVAIKSNVILTKAMQRFVGTSRENWQKLLPIIEKPHGLVVELTN